MYANAKLRGHISLIHINKIHVMMNITRSHMTIFSSAYKSQMMVKVKFVNSLKYQSVTIKMKWTE